MTAATAAVIPIIVRMILLLAVLCLLLALILVLMICHFVLRFSAHGKNRKNTALCAEKNSIGIPDF